MNYNDPKPKWRKFALEFLKYLLGALLGATGTYSFSSCGNSYTSPSGTSSPVNPSVVTAPQAANQNVILQSGRLYQRGDTVYLYAPRHIRQSSANSVDSEDEEDW